MKLLCIGDSNTYGYDPRSYIGSGYSSEVRWTERLNDCEVINCGVNGMTVPREYTRQLGLIRQHEPDLVTVMLGTNDLCSGLSADEIAERMEAFLASISSSGSPILLIAPPLLQFGEWVIDDDILEESHHLGEEYRKIANRNGFFYADSEEWDIDISFDGVHFSEDGHAKFAEKLNEVLASIK